MLVGPPFDQQVAAWQRHRRLALGAPGAGAADERRARRRTAGPGEPGAAFPGAQDDVVRRLDVRDRDVGALGKDRMILEQRAEAAEVVAPDVAADPEYGVRIAHRDHRRRM